MATGPLAAVRRRSRSIAVPPWVVTFTFVLMHTCEKVPVSVLVANALWAVTWARAEGAAGLPVPPSMVSRVAEVQLEKSLLENSSAKIADDPDWTRIGSDARLLVLVFTGVAESWASTS